MTSTNTITVTFRGQDYTGRIMATDDGWQDAANRAIKRAAGRSASVWGWTLENEQRDRVGNIVRQHYKASVVGRNVSGGSHPVLGEARVSL